MQQKLDVHLEAYERAQKRLGDGNAAIAVMQELGKDILTREMRADRGSGYAARESVAADAEDLPATEKQIAYLKRLGFDGDPASLSKAQASNAVDELIEQTV